MMRKEKTHLLFLPFLATLIVLTVWAAVPPQVRAQCTDPQNPQWCPSTNNCIPARDLCLLEATPGGVNVIPASGFANLQGFFQYINVGMWKWAFSIGIAIAVLNGTFAGFQIVMSSGDSGIIASAKTRFIWSAVGLIMLLLTGVILQFLNPTGFRNL